MTLSNKIFEEKTSDQFRAEDTSEINWQLEKRFFVKISFVELTTRVFSSDVGRGRKHNIYQPKTLQIIDHFRSANFLRERRLKKSLYMVKQSPSNVLMEILAKFNYLTDGRQWFRVSRATAKRE